MPRISACILLVIALTRDMRIRFYSTLIALCSFCATGIGQAFEPLDPDDVLVVWDFNDASTEDHAVSLSHGTQLDFVGEAAFSSDRTGR